MPPPRIPATAMASTICGNASMISTMRMIMLSTAPPYHPAIMPSTVPITNVTATRTTAENIEVRAPMRTREKTHLPYRSVPKRYFALGEAFMFAAFVAFGSFGTISGASSPMSIRTPARVRKTQSLRFCFLRAVIVRSMRSPHICPTLGSRRR